MIYLIWPSCEQYVPRVPETLLVGEIEDYDFSECSEQIYRVLHVLNLCNLIPEMPYSSAEEVHQVLTELIDDVDLGSDEVQISEHKNIRVEFRDELLAIEVYVGV